VLGPGGGDSIPARLLPGEQWPGQRDCCASTHGGRHNITCPEVAGHRARACCASQPTQVHTPSCPGSAQWRDLLDEQEHHTAPRAAHIHRHADVCTEACPAYGNYRDPAQLQPVAVVQASPGHVHDAATPDVCGEGCPAYMGFREHTLTISGGPATFTGGPDAPARPCCGTMPGTGHLAGCDQQGD
jgi:hypothetical protein